MRILYFILFLFNLTFEADVPIFLGNDYLIKLVTED